VIVALGCGGDWVVARAIGDLAADFDDDIAAIGRRSDEL
jgi:hypothetical protein